MRTQNSSVYGNRRLQHVTGGDWKVALVIITILILLAALITGGVAYFGSHTTVNNCTVTSKDRSIKVSSDSDGNTSSSTDYRVYTSCGVFSVDDSLFFGKFNAADTYGQLLEGKTYNVETVGWRNGFFSMFPNILSAEAVK